MVSNWLFEPHPCDCTSWEVILWWEKRRFVYNLAVGLLGVISLLLFAFFVAQSGVLKPGEDAVEPMAVFAAPFAINLAYTSGWIVELLWRSLTGKQVVVVSPLLMKAGLGFSTVVLSLPAILGAIVWGRHLLHLGH